MSGRPSDREIDAAREVLMGLPSFEEMEGSAEVVMSEMRDALEEEFGPIEWLNERSSRDVGGCTMPEANVGYAFSEDASSRGVVTRDFTQNDRIIEILEGIAVQHGFTGKSVLEAVSGTRYIDLQSSRGGLVSIVTGEPSDELWVIWVTTDCYLTQERQDELRAEGY